MVRLEWLVEQIKAALDKGLGREVELASANTLRARAHLRVRIPSSQYFSVAHRACADHLWPSVVCVTLRHITLNRTPIQPIKQAECYTPRFRVTSCRRMLYRVENETQIVLTVFLTVLYSQSEI